jgi:transposase
MNPILDVCCGLDVHKDSIVACLLKTESTKINNPNKEMGVTEIRTFSTFPESLEELKKWLESEKCRHVAMESTGVYWFPVYETLEDAFDGEIQILVTNARHMRNVPGRKTDVKDAEWIANLLCCGLLRGSFIPDKEVRELRDLTRYRKHVVQDITKQKNRIEKSLQKYGFKLSTFMSDILCISGRNIINLLVEKGNLNRKDVDRLKLHISPEKKNDIKRFITGKLTPNQQNSLKLQLNYLDSQIVHLKQIEESIAEIGAAFQEAIDRLDTIPGIAQTAATAIIAEIGPNVDKFPTAEHFCSWAGLAPQNNESAGKKKAHVSIMEIRTSRV